MTHVKIKIVFILFFLVSFGGYAQQTCYQIGLNEGREIYNEAQRLANNGRCAEAIPKYLDALNRFRLTRSCRDLPANHELEAWEDRCVQGIAACGGKSDEQTFLHVSPQSLAFDENGGERTITVNTNSNAWRVERYPPWCTIQTASNRLTVRSQSNTGTDSRQGTLVVVANTLRYEITIEQAGRAPIETPAFASIKFTGVQFAGKYADGTIKNFGEELFNDMNFLRMRITCDHLAMESKRIQLDFKILDPGGKLLSNSNSATGYTYSEEITARGNRLQNDVFDVSEWGAQNGTLFAMTGKYTFEIWCSGVNMFSTAFDVLPKPAPVAEAPTAASFEEVRQAPPPVSTVYPAYSASPSKIKTGIGIKAGLNLANINNETLGINFSPEIKPDFHAGILFNLNFGYKNNTPGFLGLQPELLYSRQGFNVGADNITFDYLTVPIMIKLYAYKGFNIEFGPWFSYLLAINQDVAVIDGNNIRISDLKGGKDAGIAAGIGYDFDFGLIAGARYQHGLSDMASNLLWTNRVISISLGWKF